MDDRKSGTQDVPSPPIFLSSIFLSSFPALVHTTLADSRTIDCARQQFCAREFHRSETYVHTQNRNTFPGTDLRCLPWTQLFPESLGGVTGYVAMLHGVH